MKDTFRRAVFSSVGRKFLMGLTGLCLVGFIIVHLVGNFTLLVPGSVTFNSYAGKLTDLGPITWIMELGLLVLFSVHIVFGMTLKVEAKKARPLGYNKHVSKGGPTYWNISSLFMAVSGFLIFVFLIIHIATFKYGPGIYEGYTTYLHGKQYRDLHRLVIESFQNPYVVGFYTVIMLLLGVHLRHGFWSAFQSLGVNHPTYMGAVRLVGWFLAITLALGFLLIPIYLYIAY